jgi:hypothetical protein
MTGEIKVRELPDHGAVLRFEDDKLADAIGSLFINFALFNSNLNTALTAQLGLSEMQARALVLPLQPRAKLELVQGYAVENRPEDAIKDVKELRSKARELADCRNHIAHDEMVLPDPIGHIHLVTVSGKHRFKPKLTELKTADLAHAAMHALFLAKEFLSLARQGSTWRAPVEQNSGRSA